MSFEPNDAKSGMDRVDARNKSSRRIRSLVTHSVAGASLVMLASCGMNDVDPDRPRAGTGAEERLESVLIRGWISADAVRLQPVLRLDASPSRISGGLHRLRGYDEVGERIFDLAVEGAEVMAAGGEPEEHIVAAVGVSSGDALRLHRVELHTADGRTAVRTSRLSGEEVERALRDPDAVRLEPLEEGFRLHWDHDRFPEIVVMDPDTRHVLAFGRQGVLMITTGLEVIELVVSEGVRSARRSVHIAR